MRTPLTVAAVVTGIVTSLVTVTASALTVSYRCSG
jgi:hypothetical protein